MFRELLQNADDAQSDTVQIHFETAAALQVSSLEPSDVSAYILVLPSYLANNLVLRLFNGPSRTMDISLRWKIGPDSQRSVRYLRFNTWRLSCNMVYLAKGNTNPEKVGAFGVGELNDPSGTASICELSLFL